MHVDCSQYWKMLIANVSRKVLVPTMHVGCSEYKRFNDLVLKKF